MWLFDFAQNEDYSYFLNEKRDTQRCYPQFNFFLLVGGPIDDLVMWPVSWFLIDISSFKIARVLSIHLLGFFCFLFYRHLRRSLVNQGTALIISLPLMKPPSFQVGVIWVTMLPLFVAMLLSFFANSLCLSALSDKPDNYKLKIIICVAMQVTSSDIYQPWAMSFVLPIIFPLLDRQTRQLNFGLQV